MRQCVCDNCGMEFEVKRFDIAKETLDGEPIEVVSFTCPKCDDRFIVSVRNSESARLRDAFQKAQDEYKYSFDPNDYNKMRKAKNAVGYRKRALINYMDKLKKRYLKELRKCGKY